MPRAAGVERGHDGAKAERTVGRGNEMAAISETNVVVLAFVIGMPEIDHRSAERAAASRQHKAGKFKGATSSARLAQVTALRRSWLEKRPRGLAGCRLMAIVTGRGGRKLLRQDNVRTGQFRPSGKHAGVEQKSATSLF